LIKLKKIKNKNFNYSFVQGRFSDEVAGIFQYFPINSWEKEFYLAKRLNFDSVEWIISDLSNPIFNSLFSKVIKKVLIKNKMKISSISMDMIMDNPLHKLTKSKIVWLSNRIKNSMKFFNIKRISIPIEERSRFNNKNEKKLALNNLALIYKKLSPKYKVCIETDMSPVSLINILSEKRFKKLGILLDLGNTRAHGFNIEDYFRLFPEKIYSIHVKYREKSYGKTQILKKNNFHELKFLVKNIKVLKNLEDISFQTFKSKRNFYSDIQKSIKNFNLYVK
tara:strand:- start:299 stop:1135 length:837 start_codon:yes stop_codon:yes gene_type:complete